MALAQDKVFINVKLVDAGGNPATIKYETSLADMAALNTEHTTSDSILGVGGIVPDLEALTDATVLSVSMGVSYKEDTASYGAAGTEVERKAVISAKKASSQEKATINIVAPIAALFLSTQGEDRNTVDNTNAALQAYLANFEATGFLRVSDGEALDDMSVPANIKGKQIHRGSKKG